MLFEKLKGICKKYCTSLKISPILQKKKVLRMISRRLLRIKVMQIYYAYLQNDNKEIEQALKTLDKSVHCTLELYYELLAIITYLADFAEQKIQTALEKKLPTKEDLNPNRRFIDNPVIETIRNAECFKKHTHAPRIPMDAHRNLIREIWDDLTGSEIYIRYMNSKNVDLSHHKQIIIHIINEYFPINENLDALIEEYGILWNDDIGFVASLLEKSIFRIKKPDNDSFLIMKEYSCESDKQFGKRLLTHSIENDEKFETLIDQHSKNWDIERIAMIDRIIMKLAITEFLYVPDVPVKVTINEYIEISKFYSTEKSNAFINGLLDQIVNALKNEGKLNKSGRGLVDNQ
jgi:transcription antitermination protein NusB